MGRLLNETEILASIDSWYLGRTSQCLQKALSTWITLQYCYLDKTLSTQVTVLIAGYHYCTGGRLPLDTWLRLRIRLLVSR
jgi:hypothetical protein